MTCESAAVRCEEEHCWLSELSVGEDGFVVLVQGPRELRRRLMEMGFCNGVRVAVVRRAPLGDPIQYCLRGYNVSLRRDEAAGIKVSPARDCAGS